MPVVTEPSSPLLPASSAWRSFLRGHAVLGGSLFAGLGLLHAATGTAIVPTAILSGLLLLLTGVVLHESGVLRGGDAGGFAFVEEQLGPAAALAARSALLLDLVVGTAILAAVSTAHANTFLPELLGFDAGHLTVGVGEDRLEWFWAVETLLLVLSLVLLETRPVRERSRLRETAGLLSFGALCLLIVAGFAWVWDGRVVTGSFTLLPRLWRNAAFGPAVALLVFLGLETIVTDAADAPGSAGRPRAGFLPLLLSASLIVVALALLVHSRSDPGFTPTVGSETPLVTLAGRMPFGAGAASFGIAALACVVLFFSAEALFTAAARLLSFSGVRTPAHVLLAAALVLGSLGVAFFLPAHDPLQALAGLFSFGVCGAYGLQACALVRARLTGGAIPHGRPPLDLPVAVPGLPGTLSLAGAGAAVGLFGVLVLVLATHPLARWVGPVAVAAVSLFAALGRGRARRGTESA